MAVWDPIEEELLYDGDLQDVKVILWKGHCSVHEKFTVSNIKNVKERDPGINVIVHPECSHEVVMLSDFSGSTKKSLIPSVKRSREANGRLGQR